MKPFASFRPILLFCLGCLLLAFPARGESLTAADAARLGIPEQGHIDWQTFYTSKDASKAVQKMEVAHPGGNRLLARLTFRKPPNFLLADLRLSLAFPALPPSATKAGEVWLRVALANYSFGAGKETEEAGAARVVQVGNQVWIAYESPVTPDRESNPLRLGFRYKAFPNATEERITPIFSRLPKGSAILPPFPAQRTTLVLSDTLYRKITDQQSTNDEREFKSILGTAYESLENKGLTSEDIEPVKRPFDPLRKRPSLPVNLPADAPGKPATALPPIAITVREESGISFPKTALKVGVPFPKGKLFDPSQLALHDSDGTIHPSALSLRARWPDGSVKWVAVDFQDTLAPDEEKSYHLSVTPASGPRRKNRAITLKEDPASLTIDTGAVRVEIDKTRFLPFKKVSLQKEGTKKRLELPLAANGFELAQGKTIFSTANAAPRSVVIEEKHDELLVVRVEGSYANPKGDLWMRYLARLTFRAGSPLVRMDFTHVNDALATEFSDFSSLQWKILAPESVLSAESVRHGKEAFEPLSGSRLNLVQWDDRRARAGDKDLSATLPGAIRVAYQGGRIGLAVEDFWQRYPKGFTADASGFALQLLPPLPRADFGADLPMHLNFPYLEGGFRMKWGMSFTERWTIDFSGQWPVEALAGLAQKAPLPLLSPDWYKETDVLGAFAAGKEPLASRWDTYFATLFEGHEQRRQRQREYGFLNYGDWFGERGRSWGNNEYDTAHAFFMQSLRTGNRDYFRSALAAARHQADVDIIHAYPDPFYIGGNYIHGIAHTGTTSHRPRHGIWSQDYGNGAWGSNGHTWAEGMTQAWLLAHDQRVAEAALELGEHLRWAVAPNFKMNVPNPRYAGWAVRATMALYRTFGDDEYLKTAELISAKASDEQDPESGGWLYPLYGGPPGNSVYMHGILIAGLSEYHRETGDAHALEVMKRAGEFVKRSWRKNGFWPYMVIADGSPHPRRDSEPSPGLNFLLSEGLAYLGSRAGDEEALEIARRAAQAQLAAPVLTATGQKVGFSLRSGVTLFGYLEDADRNASQPPTHPSP